MGFAKRLPSNDQVAERHEHWLGEILGQDPALAAAWLTRFLQATSEFVAFRMEKIVAIALGTLDAAERKRLLTHVTPASGMGGVIRQLVASDLAAYETLLAMPELANFHLAPLEGPPDGTWPERCATALAAGFTVEEVAQATLPTMWGWSDSESAFWLGWREPFEPMLSHPNPPIQAIVRRVVEIVEGRVARARDEERAGAIRGI